MHFEHTALNVPDPKAMAAWYVDNCDLRIIVATDSPPYMHFVADVTGRIVFELYANPKAPIPNYADQHPLVLHLAFAVEDIASAKARLLAAGATEFSDESLPNGSRLVMLRDPWGIPLQLVMRAESLGA
jgi:glyoxylase I family protein